MNKIILLLCILLLHAGAAVAGNIPKSIAGFTLGDHLSKYKDKIVADSAICIRYQNYLNEVEINDTPGYKTGLICTGNCASPGKIVRIKLKYQDSSKEFYDELLERFKKKYDKPHEWKGDAFGVVHAWKWSFKDEEGNNISLTLQHNTEDQEMKMGNSVKLAMTNAIEKEKACYEAEEEQELKRLLGSRQKPKKRGPNWKMLVPQ